MDASRHDAGGHSEASPAPTDGAAGGSTAGASGGGVRPKRARAKSDKPRSKDDSETLARFHCNYCKRDLSAAIRARCAVCADYDLCLDCFSVGATLSPHKPNHDYRLIEVVSTPVYAEDWGADEEERLLEGLELYGVGNWEEVAKVIRTKNSAEAEAHFRTTCLKSPTAPLPDITRILPAAPPTEQDGADADVDAKCLRVMHLHQVEEACGWMPLRGDFTYEWDQDAEEIIADMELLHEDSPEEIEMKLRVLQIYSAKLDERAFRKEFVVSRNLLDFKAAAAADKKRPREERDLSHRLRPFLRFHSDGDHRRLLADLTEDRLLRQKIDKLRYARALSAFTLEDANRVTASLPASVLSPSAASVKADAAAATAAASAAPAAAPPPPGRRGKKSVAALSASMSPAARAAATAAAASAAAAAAATAAGSNGSGGADGRCTTGNGGTIDAINGGGSGGGSGSGGGNSRARAAVPPLDVRQMAGADLLSRAELDLVVAVKVSPHQYLLVKEALVREAARVGYVRKKDVKLLVRLEPVKVNKLYDYIAGAGWISTGPGVGGRGNKGAAAVGSAHTVPTG
ncbi:hypothetical protein MMPV_008944 [Pyropia vietnamensis]